MSLFITPKNTSSSKLIYKRETSPPLQNLPLKQTLNFKSILRLPT